VREQVREHGLVHVRACTLATRILYLESDVWYRCGALVGGILRTLYDGEQALENEYFSFSRRRRVTQILWRSDLKWFIFLMGVCRAFMPSTPRL